MNPIFYIDFYKVGHIDQYPQDITKVWSNWTPRSSRVPGVNSVVHLGQRYFIAKYLIEEFNANFFARSEAEVIAEYREVIATTLFITDPRTDHIRDLHRLGYLPLKIYSIPEGFSTPLNVPSMVLTNTHPKFFWLPNYFESVMSAILWKPSTSATTAREYRKICLKYAKESGETDFGPVDWQCHDFSLRGMSGMEDAVLSGIGHLTCFSGTDSLPAILAAVKYYDAELSVGGSVPATEHSVMCAGNQDGELETFRRLIEDIYPTGIVSIVSDTWDLWKVLIEYIPALKEKILARKGKVVIRPDSGDPVKIMCGNFDNIESGAAYGLSYHPARAGVLRLLRDSLGVIERKPAFPLINNAAAIYGDSITPERANAILLRTKAMGLSPYNVVFGVGSFTYEWVTRDTFGFAMKATAVMRNGKIVAIFKKPVTDDGGKFSCKGIPVVYRTQMSTDANPVYFLEQEGTEDQLNNCAFEVAFEDGKHLIKPNFDTIRERVRACLA